MLAAQDKVDETLAFLRVRADIGNHHAAKRLAALLGRGRKAR